MDQLQLDLKDGRLQLVGAIGNCSKKLLLPICSWNIWHPRLLIIVLVQRDSGYVLLGHLGERVALRSQKEKSGNDMRNSLL